MYRYLYFFLCFLFYSCHKDNSEFLSLSNNVVTFDWRSNTKEIIIKSNAHWSILSTLPSWILINRVKEGNETSSISLTVSDNETGYTRKCSIIISGIDNQEVLLISQTAKEKLCFVGKKEYSVHSSGMELLVDIEQNIDYKVFIAADARSWITQSLQGSLLGNSNTNIGGRQSLILNISDNPKQGERRTKVAIYNQEYNLSDTIYIKQEANSGDYFYIDGEYKRLQQATKGNGVNLIFMGDGFTSEDLEQNGRYEKIMKQAIDYFFSIEPYQSYREFFNIYMIVAESEEEGVSTSNLFGEKISNKFSTTFGDGTAITCNDDLVFEYARKIKELPSNKPLTIIMPLNSTKYAGTTYLYSNGNSIALCPMSSEASPNDFEGLIHHEAGGHGFGFLCDEYVYYQTKIPDTRKNEIREWQKLGFQCNLDFTNDLSSILWKAFIGVDKYTHVGAYEGGYEYRYGVWRSESNSCMNNNIPYYNVQSRWSIVSRIMKLAGMDFTVQDFIEADHATLWSGATRNIISEKALPPLGSPILIK